jgi:hypothetical protein
VFELSKSEKMFVKKFFKADFKPELLFGNKIRIKNIDNHPMVLWKQKHIKEWIK